MYVDFLLKNVDLRKLRKGSLFIFFFRSVPVKKKKNLRVSDPSKSSYVERNRFGVGKSRFESLCSTATSDQDAVVVAIITWSLANGGEAPLARVSPATSSAAVELSRDALACCVFSKLHSRK